MAFAEAEAVEAGAELAYKVGGRFLPEQFEQLPLVQGLPVESHVWGLDVVRLHRPDSGVE